MAAALLAAFRTAPQPYGDAPEYLLMAESLFRHGSPELREGDLFAVTRAFERYGIEFPPHGRLLGYYKSEDEQRFSYHFWAYSAATLPVRLLLSPLGLDPLKAPQVTNALLMAATLLVVLLFAPLGEPHKLLLNALLYLSPALWFILWPHPEVFSFAFTAIALVLFLRRSFGGAVLCVAVAALQNPQLSLLLAFFWAKGAMELRLGWRGGLLVNAAVPWRRALAMTLPALVVTIHPLFYYWHFGTPSIVADEATSLGKLSVSRALGLLFDLNLGLLPYIPVALLAYLVAVGRSGWRERRVTSTVQLFAVLSAILLANTLQWNYNHGTSGPSRYVIWLLPIIFFGLIGEARGRGWLVTATLAVLVQLGVVWSRGGFVPPYDYLRHSPVAAFVLDHAPWLYSPDYEVFIKRTLHVEGQPTQGPYVYKVDGRCRKVLARRDHEQKVREQCGSVPERYLPFFRAKVSRPSQRKAWRYLSY